ncbi:F-box/LRR-repeat protein 4-like [Homalodisca vitripennis]|uniref:F-box/LRR-repeat protein 4-like n=2 Tax=Homalodisca vitripennis TaxID=197043 RepID=UPI001EEA0503|nr:F-box/LRR-repeat protein 4-like [Homalodisca vitripennis]
MADVRLSMIENSLQEDEEDSEITFIEQFVQDVVDFSSQYGSDISISYTAYNIAGKPSKFPDYGDFPQAFVMRTYGNWWNEAPSRRQDFMLQNYGKIISHDFIDVTFDEPVYPFRVSVYETYNPGSVVRIWAATTSAPIRWRLLWEGEARLVGHKPHIFSPPINAIDFPTRMLRLEFDHSRLDYYTEIDALLLVGTRRPTPIPSPGGELDPKDKEAGDLTRKIMDLNIHSVPPHVDLENTLNQFLAGDYRQLLRELEDTAAMLIGAVETITKVNSGSFSCLPDETTNYVFSFLDLPSLCQCAKVNRHFHQLATDSLLYTKVNLRPYWHCVNDGTLSSLSDRCRHLVKLDLSWCGSYDLITTTNMAQFIKTTCKQLTTLRLDCCRFVDDTIIKAVASTCRNIKELTLRNCSRITSEGFNSLATVSTIERLDLYRTHIEMQPLVNILKASPALKHINLGSCVRVSSMDEVAQALGNYNPQLVTVDFWKTYSLTPVGVRAISKCSMLEEVDFGWCLGVSVPGDCLNALAVGCPRLQKLFMAALRGIMDRDLEPFLQHCPRLRQVDLLGVRSITADICLRFLCMFNELQLLDLSFCDQIQESLVAQWRQQFPHVSIKRSFQSEGTAGCYLPNHY